MEARDAPKARTLAELSPGQRLDHPLYHRDGTLLLLAGAMVDASLLRALGQVGIEEVFLCETELAARALRQAEGLVEVDVASLPDGRPVEHNLYNEDGELIWGRGQTLSESLLGDLVKSGEIRLFRECSFYEAVRERFDEALAREVAATLEERIMDDPSLLRVEKGGEPFAERCEWPAPAERTRSGIDEARRAHAMALASTHGLLERGRREGKLDLLAAQEIVTELLERMQRDVPLALALADTALHSDYLVDHSLAVAVHSASMGLALDYDRAQSTELALGALLHDIGMTQIDGRLIEKRGPLDPEEVEEIRRHPRAGMELLQGTPGAAFPLPFAVFQDHERTDGRGYPKGRADGWIHDHAKVIGVADVYQAMSAPRPYKPRRTPHRAALQLLRMVQDMVLDPVAVRAFLTTHGVFPVGSWLRLSDGRTCRVVGSSDEAYDRPVVSAVTGAEGEPLTTPEVIDLSAVPAVGVLEDLDAEAAGFDFAAGFHLEGPASREIESVPAEGERRKVPASFIDWSASFSGYLSEFGVLDLVRILDVSQKSGVLVLRFPEAEGLVRIFEGEILSCELHPAKGDPVRDEEAIYRMAEMHEGTFRFEQGAVDRRKTVKLDNNTILMEACRRLDERARGG